MSALSRLAPRARQVIELRFDLGLPERSRRRSRGLQEAA